MILRDLSLDNDATLWLSRVNSRVIAPGAGIMIAAMGNDNLTQIAARQMSDSGGFFSPYFFGGGGGLATLFISDSSFTVFFFRTF